MATWDLQASAGATGKSILWRGAWSSASSYNPYDAVSAVGNSYISKTNNANKDPVFNPSDWDLLAAAGGQLRNYLAGLTLSNGTDAVNDINIAVGECRDDTNSANIVIGSALVKQLDAVWVAGTGVGGRDTGAIADGTWHVFAIRNPTTGVCDVLFSLSVSAPTMPSGYTQKRRIGSIVRKSGALMVFRQYGDYFQFTTPPQDISASQTPAQSGNYGLPSIPAGMKFRCHLNMRASNNNTGGNTTVEFNDPDQTSPSIGTIFVVLGAVTGYVTDMWCDSSHSLYIYTRTAPASSTTNFIVSVLGYWDYRGKDD